MDNRGKEKRRRTGKEADESKPKKVRKQGDTEEEATEEEVEEFFAILRRMQVAVKYFEKENKEGWRAAVEAEVVAAVGAGEEDDRKNDDEIEITEGSPEKIYSIEEEQTAVLDLNSLPAAE